MARFEWNHELSVGLSNIDKQHKSLIDYINELDDSMRQGKGKDVVGHTLKSLVDYTSTH